MMKYSKLFLALGILPVVVLILNFRHTDYTTDFNEDYNIYALPIPESIDFAGEKVPLEIRHVKEAFDRELLVNTYWQSQTLLFIKLTHQYFPVIEPILKENNIPDDFKYLAVAESGLRNITSPAGAEGFWQLMEGTAEDYGLEVNDVVDERYHLEKATEAACKYLKESYAKYNSWTLTAASYNSGRAGLNKQIEKQGENNYYNLTLGDETGRYVYRIIAIKEILSNPSKYGFHYRPEDLYPPNETYITEVDTAIKEMAEFNKVHNVSYKTLKYYNPWLRDNYLHKTTGKTYQIAIPKQQKTSISE